VETSLKYADERDLSVFSKRLGSVPMPMTPADFAKFIADETEKWAKVVKFSGAKVD